MCYLSAFSDFYMAVSPVPRTMIAYTRQELLSHDFAYAAARKAMLSQALFMVIQNSCISAFAGPGLVVTSANQFAR